MCVRFSDFVLPATTRVYSVVVCVAIVRYEKQVFGVLTISVPIE